MKKQKKGTFITTKLIATMYSDYVFICDRCKLDDGREVFTWEEDDFEGKNPLCLCKACLETMCFSLFADPFRC